MKLTTYFLLLTVAVSAVACAPMQQTSIPPNPTRACFDAALQQQEFDKLKERMVLGLERPTLDMQADQGVPNELERLAILSYAKVRDQCYSQGSGWNAQYRPLTYRSVDAQIIGRIDANVAALYRGDLSFGKYNVKIEALRLEGRRLLDQARAIEQRESDNARRQAAIAALLATQPQPQPQRVMPQNSNTTCQVLGSQMYCNTTSR